MPLGGPQLIVKGILEVTKIEGKVVRSCVDSYRGSCIEISRRVDWDLAIYRLWSPRHDVRADTLMTCMRTCQVR